MEPLILQRFSEMLLALRLLLRSFSMFQTFILPCCAERVASSLPSLPFLKSIQFDNAAGKQVAMVLIAFCAPCDNVSAQDSSRAISSASPFTTISAAAADLESSQASSRPVLDELVLEQITFKLCKHAPTDIGATLQSFDYPCHTYLKLDCKGITVDDCAGIITPIGELPSLLHLHCGLPRYKNTPPPATVLANLLEGAKHLQQLCLHLYMPGADWQTVAPSVAMMSTLTRLGVSGFFPLAPASRAPKGIQFLSTVQALNVTEPRLSSVSVADVCATLHGFAREL
jgi:hypothetical protein